MSRVMAGARVEPGSGSSSPTLFVIAGSVITIATSRGSRAARRASGSLNCTIFVLEVTSRGRPPSSGHESPSCRSTSASSKWPWYLPSKNSDLVPAGQRARDADRLGVGVRRAQRELPLRQAVPAAELLRDPERVLVRQQELRAPRHAAAHGLHHRLRRVAAEHAHVRDVEVGVLVAVDVAEPRAVPSATNSGGWS